MSDFLESNLSEEVIQKIAKHCSFKAMRDNQMSNFKLVPKELMDSDISPFLRKGEDVFTIPLLTLHEADSGSSVKSWHFRCYRLDWVQLCFFEFYFIHFKTDLLCSCNCYSVHVFVPGVVGDWENHFTSEQLQRFTSVIQKELQDESFSLPWSLEWPTLHREMESSP